MSSNKTEYAFFIGLLIAVSIGFFVLLAGFFQPIFWAATVGIIFLPVQHGLERKLKGRRSLAAALSVLLIFFTVLVPALLVGSAVASEAVQLYSQIQRGDLDPGGVLRWFQELMPQATAFLERLGIDVEQVPGKLSAAAVKASQFVAGLALSTGQNLARFAVMFFVMLYLLFFVLRDGDRLLAEMIRALPLGDDRERALFAKFAEVARATIKGTLVVGLVQGALGGAIFWLLGIQGAVFWGVVMVIMSVIPAVGASLIWAPAAVFLLASGDWGKAVALIAFGVLVIGLVDNFLRPLLVGRDTKMPDYLILLSTLGGMTLFGISGFVIGPIIASMFLAVWSMFAKYNSATNQ
jgi:predicted PurR-regulated permease PerM